MAAKASDASLAGQDRLAHRFVESMEWQQIVARGQVQRSGIGKVAQGKLKIVIGRNLSQEGDGLVTGAESPFDGHLSGVTAIIGAESGSGVLNKKLQPKRGRTLERKRRRESAGERMIDGAVQTARMATRRLPREFRRMAGAAGFGPDEGLVLRASRQNQRQERRRQRLDPADQYSNFNANCMRRGEFTWLVITPN